MKQLLFGIFAVIIISISFLSCGTPEAYEEPLGKLVFKSILDNNDSKNVQGSTYEDSIMASHLNSGVYHWDTTPVRMVLDTIKGTITVVPIKPKKQSSKVH